MSSQKTFKILFLCTGNTARSIFGEYLIRRLGLGRFESYSAGADPKPRVNPYAFRVLRDAFKIDASAARTKSWDEYQDWSLILLLPFVITPKSGVLFGLANQLSRIGPRQILQNLKATTEKPISTSGR